MIVDWWFYLMAVPALIIFGISKGGFGGGIGVIAVPMMALAIPAPVAAAIMLPVLCMMDLIGLKHYWRKWDPQQIKVMLPAGLVGVALGSLVFELFSERGLQLLLGLISVLFALHYFLKPNQHKPRPHRPWLAGFAAAAGGLTSTIAHAGGPPINMYLLPLQLDKTVFVGTMTLLFAAVNYSKLAGYGFIGLFTPEVLWTALVLTPVAAFGMVTGIWLHNRINQELFLKICYGCVLFVGVNLLLKALTA